jgi:hypothetical protein
LAKTNYEALNLAVVVDDFDVDMFDENVDIERHVEEDDEIAISKSDEENVQPSVDTAPDAPVGTVDEGNKANIPLQQLLHVMSRHLVTLTEVHITQTKS